MGGSPSSREPSSEQTSYLRRLTKGAKIALVVWPLFFLVDVYIVALVEPRGRLLVFALLRLLGMLVLLGAVMRLTMERPPSPLVARAIDTGAITTMIVLISVACMEIGGIASPLALGVITVLVGRGALIAESWRKALFPIAISTLAHPVTLLVMTLFVPAMREQLAEPREVAAFGLNQLFVGGAAAVALYAGQAVEDMRRQVLTTRSLGRYDLVQKIGEGGMGAVWRARDKALVRDVAVKILQPAEGSEESHVTRFEREARATARLEHPNTIRVFDFGASDDGTLYYAMELLEGADLGTVLLTGRLSPRRAVEIVIQACHSLAEAHERGVIHRDLKPENIFLTEVAGLGDFVKVLDFGLAKVGMELRADDDDETLTRVGHVVGTPTYLSPEVCMGLEADARSDVYALGTVLYVAICGRPPFSGDLKSLIKQRLRDEPPPPSRHAEVPPGLEAVIVRALRRDPADRFQSALEMAAALAEADLGPRAEAICLPRPSDDARPAPAPRPLRPSDDDPPSDTTLIDDVPATATRR